MFINFEIFLFCCFVSIKFDCFFDMYYLFYLFNLIKDSSGYLRWKSKWFVLRVKSELFSMLRFLFVIIIRYVFYKCVSLEWVLWFFEFFIVEFFFLI